MTSSATPSDVGSLPGRRDLARQRLYVVCQVIGWTIFAGSQWYFVNFLGKGDGSMDALSRNCMIIMVVLQGLLLSHLARYLIHRWGWSNLSWAPLIPRVAAMAIVLSATWAVAGYTYDYVLLENEFPQRYTVFQLMLVSVINGSIIFGVWLCIYFFYQMFDRYTRSEIERLRLATVVKESELRALKSQVNPHFMFNSLNSVRALIDEDPARARQSITQLANMLRYSLQSGQLETVPFADELSVVNDYLALEQVRHEERLRLRLDVKPETLRLPVPPMVLQTLVENAIKYGISSRAEGGEIRIGARVENGTLLLTVSNPGTLSSAGADISRRGRSTGIGLQNALERLRLLFGEEATVELTQASADMVCAKVIIPLGDKELAHLRSSRDIEPVPSRVPAATL